MVTHHTFTIERTYPSAPEKVFAAFTDPSKKRRWYADGHGVETFEMDFRLGGVDRASFVIGEGPVKGSTITSEARYQDIIPNERLVIAYTMRMNGNPMSASQSTFQFVPSEGGTKLILTEQGAYFEPSDGPEMRQVGWTSLMERLGQALESA